jgi:translation elongation factor EF-4
VPVQDSLLSIMRKRGMRLRISLKSAQWSLKGENEADDQLNMMLNGKPVDALAMIVHRSAAQSIGRAWTKKLRT